MPGNDRGLALFRRFQEIRKLIARFLGTLPNHAIHLPAELYGSRQCFTALRRLAPFKELKPGLRSRTAIRQSLLGGLRDIATTLAYQNSSQELQVSDRKRPDEQASSGRPRS